MSRRCARAEVDRKRMVQLSRKIIPPVAAVLTMEDDVEKKKTGYTIGGAASSRYSTRSLPPSYETVVAPGYIPAGNNFLVIEKEL